MKIKLITAVAGSSVWILLAWPAIAAGAPNASGAAANHDDQITTAGKHFILQATAEDGDVETVGIDAGGSAKDNTNETPANGTGQTAAQDDAVETTEFNAGATAKGEANTQAGDTTQTSTEQPQTFTTPKPAVTSPDRDTRPRTDEHEDARACLDAGDNPAIIKCAEKYR